MRHPIPIPIPITRAARAWTLADLRASEAGISRDEKARRHCALKLAHDQLITSTMHDQSRIGRLLFDPQNVDRWPEILLGLKPRR